MKEKWDGVPVNADRKSWHLLLGSEGIEVPFQYVPGHQDKRSGPYVTPWWRPNIHGPTYVYRECDVARDWSYVGPMKIEKVG